MKNVFSWFDAKQAQEFGTALAKIVVQTVPPNAELPEKKFSQKVEAALRKMQRLVEEFKVHNALNFYKKAQLGNAFKWSLKDAGFDKAYASRLTEWLLERL